LESVNLIKTSNPCVLIALSSLLLKLSLARASPPSPNRGLRSLRRPSAIVGVELTSSIGDPICPATAVGPELVKGKILDEGAGCESGHSSILCFVTRCVLILAAALRPW
ncbi:hypothetical protein L9F63_022780, partial [Diploptera punctata]